MNLDESCILLVGPSHEYTLRHGLVAKGDTLHGTAVQDCGVLQNGQERPVSGDPR